MKQQEKSKIMQEKILFTAQKLFLSKGYEETTLDDIIAESNSSKGALYHHFKSKQDILKSMIEYFIGELNQYIQTLAMDKSMNTKQKISNMILYFNENKTQQMFINNQWLEKVPFAFLYSTKNTLSTLTDYFEMIICQGIANNEYSCEYPREIASILLLLFDIWLDPNLSEMSMDEVSKKIDFILEFLKRFDLPIFDEQDVISFKSICQTLNTSNGDDHE